MPLAGGCWPRVPLIPHPMVHGLVCMAMISCGAALIVQDLHLQGRCGAQEPAPQGRGAVGAGPAHRRGGRAPGHADPQGKRADVPSCTRDARMRVALARERACALWLGLEAGAGWETRVPGHLLLGATTGRCSTLALAGLFLHISSLPGTAAGFSARPVVEPVVLGAAHRVAALPEAQVPWSSLGQDPVVVQMDRLFLLARPQPETARQAIATPEDVDKAYQASKRQWVSSHESKWLEQLDALDKAKEEAASGDKEPAGGGGLFGGFARIKGAIETAIGRDVGAIRRKNAMVVGRGMRLALHGKHCSERGFPLHAGVVAECQTSSGCVDGVAMTLAAGPVRPVRPVHRCIARSSATTGVPFSTPPCTKPTNRQCPAVHHQHPRALRGRRHRPGAPLCLRRHAGAAVRVHGGREWGGGLCHHLPAQHPPQGAWLGQGLV